ncbi:MAG TPA: ATP-binding protein [Thermoleophilaceae bacterium]|nr:ATP-binding protein [Thermoleophilaceae bacterium]
MTFWYLTAMGPLADYQRRIVDDDLDELLGDLPAIALEGPKGVGKTRTALQRANTVHRLDDPDELAIAEADPARLLEGERPILIDEWQRLPQTWDLVRRAVDDGAPPGSFLLTGSALPDPPPTHSGAGRIVTLRMRPLAMSERLQTATVSLGELLSGDHGPVIGTTDLALAGYTEEILASGLPGLRSLSERARRLQLDGYLDRVVDRDIPDDAGVIIRSPAALRRWMAAYAAASSTTATFEKLRDAASAGHEHKPSKNASHAYRDALARVWMLDEVPAWIPSNNRLRELGQAPKHQLADPALAAQLLGAQASTLLTGQSSGPSIARDGTLLGALFESLATQSVQVYAARCEAKVGHLRTARGRHEVDLIVERADGGVVAMEVKLARSVAGDAKHLTWLEQKLGDRVLDRVILTTGPEAYRRQDGIAVVPLALLGP